ncbi:hypothetical protein CRG98_045081 [Punica granatum]|uniref:Uncharacterized protein n=1 Tax=Punica granatum TaxID=22663 RepID=A0A2I0HS50_PUNGR|nr:hypothetical protein CRG98_045081 [Punica granatum]
MPPIPARTNSQQLAHLTASSRAHPPTQVQPALCSQLLLQRNSGDNLQHDPRTSSTIELPSQSRRSNPSLPTSAHSISSQQQQSAATPPLSLSLHSTKLFSSSSSGLNDDLPSHYRLIALVTSSWSFLTSPDSQQLSLCSSFSVWIAVPLFGLYPVLRTSSLSHSTTRGPSSATLRRQLGPI